MTASMRACVSKIRAALHPCMYRVKPGSTSMVFGFICRQAFVFSPGLARSGWQTGLPASKVIEGGDVSMPSPSSFLLSLTVRQRG